MQEEIDRRNGKLESQLHTAPRRQGNSSALEDELTASHQRIKVLEQELRLATQNAILVQEQLEALRSSRSWKLTAPYRAVGAIVKDPFCVIAGSGVLFRAALGLLLLLPAMVYCGGFFAVVRDWRRTPHFAATVLGAQNMIRERLDARPRWLRRLVFLCYSLGLRLYGAGSVSRVVRAGVHAFKAEGMHGLRLRLLSTAPGARTHGPSLGGADENSQSAQLNSEGRVMVLDYRVPRGDTSAGEFATIGILRDLADIGYEVVFAPNDMQPSPQYEAELRRQGVEVITRNTEYHSTADYVERNGAKFGVFYIFRIEVAEAVLPSIRRVAPCARVIFHAPDLHFLRERRAAKMHADSIAAQVAEDTRLREISVMRNSDHVVIVSPAELPVLEDELRGEVPISVLPALYARVEQQPVPFERRSNIFFLGGFGHSPNAHSVLWFAQKVWPMVHSALPDVEFHIIGAEAPDSVLSLEAMPGIKVVGFVPDLAPILALYRISVAPLLYGAGIKGKVATALGAGIPCVCTEIAAEGMGIENGVHSLVENDADAFAAAVVSLYGDRDQWNSLSRNGQDLVRNRFGETANRKHLLQVLDNARVLPLTLMHKFCQKTRHIVMPDLAGNVDVTIVIPAYNKWSLTRTCLASIMHADVDMDIRYEVILADDGSDDETVVAEKLIPGLRVKRLTTNLGYLRNCNQAAKAARGKYLLLLNNDAVVLPGWMKALYRTMEADSSIAIAGSKLLYPSGKIQDAGGGILQDAHGVSIGRWLYRGGKPWPGSRDEPVFSYQRETDYLTGASIMVRKAFWDTVGGFDERYDNAYCEDSDLAMQARQRGHRVVYEPASEVIHLEHQSYMDEEEDRHSALRDKNHQIFLKKWKTTLNRSHLPAETPWHIVAAHGERSIPSRVMERRKASDSLNILYFTPFPSHPNNHGNQATIQQFARQLQMLGHKVHFALLASSMFSSSDEQQMRQAWDALDILPNTLHLGANGEDIPFDGWYEDGLGERIRALCFQYEIDVVLCSYIFQSKMLEFIPSYILRIIDTHDKMGNRYEMLRQKGLPVEFFSCTPEEEGRYLRRADLVFARRQEEAEYFNAVSGTNSAIVVPHFEAPRFVEEKSSELRHVGIVASANRINLAIVHDFLVAIDGQFKRGECPFTILIAGQVEELVPSLSVEQRALFERPWVRMLGFVADIDAFYGKVDLVVSPVTMGTGINVKTVQAMAYGMPLLTTEWGSKGIATTEPLHRLPDLASLTEALLKLSEDPRELRRLAEVSRHVYQSFFDMSLASLRDSLQLVPRSALGDFEPRRVATREEWHPDDAESAKRREIENRIVRAQPPGSSGHMTVRARCCVCGVVGMICEHQSQKVNWRETMTCPHCHLNSRMRAAVHVLQNHPKLTSESAIYITEKKTNLFDVLHDGRWPGLVGSEFLGDECALGKELNGIRNEDLTRLTFEENSIDAVLSFDVLEHIPNYRAALQEVFRCLRPGGILMVTAPFNAEMATTLVRARVDGEGHIHHLMPPEYHNDPNSESKILCFQTFGWDLLDDMRKIGFADVAIADCWSREFGYLGETLLILGSKPSDDDHLPLQHGRVH